MVYSVCKRRSYEPVVQNDLAVTPEKMAELTKLGIPVSSQNISLGYENSGGDSVPREFIRGIDINDLWNDVQDSRVKAKKLKFETSSNTQTSE